SCYTFIRNSHRASPSPTPLTLHDALPICLYHDQALFKEAGGGRTPWHQDMYYWPLDTDRTITMWMPLVDVPAEVGSMLFASGSQDRKSTRLNSSHVSISYAVFCLKKKK